MLATTAVYWWCVPGLEHTVNQFKITGELEQLVLLLASTVPRPPNGEQQTPSKHFIDSINKGRL